VRATDRLSSAISELAIFPTSSGELVRDEVMVERALSGEHLPVKDEGRWGVADHPGPAEVR
jgi:hypothetical protein